MHDFFTRQRENLLANIIASIIFVGIATVVSWFSKFPPIPVPAWLFIAIIAILLARWWFSRPIKKLIPVVNETFGVERVYVDGKHFADCEFVGSELVFQGKKGFSIKGCNIVSFRLTFEGNAGIVLSQLITLNNSDEFKPYVQQILNQSPSHTTSNP